MNSNLPRKQVSTPIKSSTQHTYSLRSDSKAKLPILSSTSSSIQQMSNQSQASQIGQPIEILPSKYRKSDWQLNCRQAVLGVRHKAPSKICIVVLLLHWQCKWWCNGNSSFSNCRISNTCHSIKISVHLISQWFTDIHVNLHACCR